MNESCNGLVLGLPLLDNLPYLFCIQLSGCLRALMFPSIDIWNWSLQWGRDREREEGERERGRGTIQKRCILGLIHSPHWCAVLHSRCTEKSLEEPS